MSREFELRIYSDVACPWCYVGAKRLKKTLESDKMKDYNFTIKPRYYPYLINETLGEDPITKDELYKSKFMGGDGATAVQSKISKEGAEEGIDFNWNKASKIRQTKPAHRVMEKAWEVGGWEVQSKMGDALYKAFHVDGLDVCDPEILAKTASSVDGFLSYDEALKFVNGDDLAYEVDKALEKAEIWGIDQVPTYILDETDSFSEAVNPETWYKAFDVISRAYGLSK